VGVAVLGFHLPIDCMKARSFSRKRRRPGRLVAGFWQYMAELDHLPRRQLIKVNPNGTPALNSSRERDSVGHQLDHAGLVHGRTPSADVAIDEDVIVRERGATHEPSPGFTSSKITCAKNPGAPVTST
jgi:hypothetical protein